MADQPNDDHASSNPRSHFQPLPIEARRRLWEQIWNRLLAPPTEHETLTQEGTRSSEVIEKAAPDVAA